MHFGTEQNVGPKPPDGPFRNGSFVGGSSVNMVVPLSQENENAIFNFYAIDALGN